MNTSTAGWDTFMPAANYAARPPAGDRTREFVAWFLSKPLHLRDAWAAENGYVPARPPAGDAGLLRDRISEARLALLDKPDTDRALDILEGVLSALSGNSGGHDDPDWPHVPDYDDLAARFGPAAADRGNSGGLDHKPGRWCGECGEVCVYQPDSGNSGGLDTPSLDVERCWCGSEQANRVHHEAWGHPFSTTIPHVQQRADELARLALTVPESSEQSEGEK